MSDREAKAIRAELISAILMYSDLADDAISATNRDRAHAQIWSTMTEADAGVLADLNLDLAKRSAMAAQAVRGIVKTRRYVNAGLIVVPRAWQTVEFYAQHGVAIPLPGGSMFAPFARARGTHTPDSKKRGAA